MILVDLVFQSNQPTCPFIGELRLFTFKIIIGRHLVILITSLLFFLAVWIIIYFLYWYQELLVYCFGYDKFLPSSLFFTYPTYELHCFLYSHDGNCFSFPSVCRIPLRFFHSLVLVVMNYLSLCLSGNVFVIFFASLQFYWICQYW